MSSWTKILFSFLLPWYNSIYTGAKLKFYLSLVICKESFPTNNGNWQDSVLIAVRPYCHNELVEYGN